MGVAKIVRESTGTVLSDQMDFFRGWESDYPEPAIKTVNNVTVLQRRGRMEWVAHVTFAFCDEFSGPSGRSSKARMHTLIRSARRNEWFIFTDRWGATHRVRCKVVPKPERDENPRIEYFYLDLELLLEGFE